MLPKVPIQLLCGLFDTRSGIGLVNTDGFLILFATVACASGFKKNVIRQGVNFWNIYSYTNGRITALGSFGCSR